MKGLTVNVNLSTRPAVYVPSHDVPDLGLKAYTSYQCDVFGCFQITDFATAYPCFVIELQNGHCTTALATDIIFVDKECDTNDNDCDRRCLPS